MEKYNGKLKGEWQIKNWLDILALEPDNLEAVGLISILKNNWRAIASRPELANKANDLVQTIAGRYARKHR